MSQSMSAPLAIGATLASAAVEAQATTAQARFAEQQASASADLARQQEAATRRQAARTSAALRGRFAAAGVAPTGSPLDVLAQKAREDELEARMLRYQGALDSASSLMRARDLRAQRTVALIGAAESVGQSLLSAGLSSGTTPKTTKPTHS